MHLRHLTLTHFRNYKQLSLDFTASRTLIQGENAQGKTNLLEAIFMLATSKPIHASSEREIVDWAAGDEPIPYSKIEGIVESGEQNTGSNHDPNLTQHVTRTTIEIQGVKLDVDLRTAVRVETLRIGDRVRCLVKSYSGYDVRPGVVIGFEPFAKLPTIQVAYVTGSTLEIRAFNEESKDFELVPALDDVLMLEREHVVEMMQREIMRKEVELDEARRKLDYFQRMFGKWFESERAVSEEVA